ncbi:MAG: N-6 DNA methylase, partial [Flavobacteriales bacterium]|nr:N-6 DNA methylase [Flavobacteriales bacterium]
LNQALDFLIAEHAYVNELEAKLLGQSIVFKDIGDHILERNIYGVDINEESVEIARLSLWLRTATKGRKLNDLSANIKCGNSLIDDPAVAGAKVFDWKKEFPAVFAKGGFDVVIGNPPWGADLNEDDLSFIKARDEDIVVRMIDSFMFFVSAALRISQPEGRLGQIVPDVILYQTDNRKLREKLLRETHLERAINLGDGIFQDVARPSAIVICSKRQSSTARTLVGSVQKNFDDDLESLNLEPVEQSLLLRMPNSMFPTVNLSGYALLSRLNFPKLLSYLDDDGVQRGVSPDLKEAFIVDDRIVETNRLELEYVKSTVTGGVDVRRFGIDNDMKRLLYVSREVDASQIRNIVEYISRFRDKITCTEVSQGKHPFYALHRPRDPAIFEKSGKLVGVITGDRIIVALDASRIYPTDGLYVFSSNGRQLSNKALGCLLNSTLLTYLYRLLSSETGRTMAQVKPVLVEELPIAAPSAKGVEHLEQLHDRIAQDMASLREIQLGVNHLLQSKYTLPTLSRALENWPGLEFKGFLAELKKAKVQLTLAEEAEWLTYFTAEKAKAQTLQAQIAKTDKEIDALVYELYGLTEEEVKVVEGK